MSTAWYKPNALPKLVRSFRSTRDGATAAAAVVEVWNTTCIVTNFGRSRLSVVDDASSSSSSAASAFDRCVLVNPSSPSLLGVRRFPYFPAGGPEPTAPPTKYEHHIMGYVSQWGGMRVEDGMLFPLNVVDGVAHREGGWRLAWHCATLPVRNDRGERCPVGEAVVTPPGGLASEYDDVVHAVPPFRGSSSSSSSEEVLGRAYASALASCREASTRSGAAAARYAVPLLGAGGRGFPVDVAVDVAASRSVEWMEQEEENRSKSDDDDDGPRRQVLAFGLPSMENARKLCDAIAACLESSRAEAA